MMDSELKIRSVSARGVFHFIKHSKYNFKGPMRIGLRPIIWYTKIEGQTTSCSLVSDAQINEGESKEVELFILNELQLQHPIIKGMVLNIGSIDHSSVNKFGEFEVLEHLGEWKKGKLP